MVEHLSCKQKVMGSIPIVAFHIFDQNKVRCGVSGIIIGKYRIVVAQESTLWKVREKAV